MRPSRCAPAVLFEVRLKSILLQVTENNWHQRMRALSAPDREPSHARIAPPPSQLPSRVLPIGLGHGMRQLFQRELTAYVCECLRVTDACEHKSGGRHTGFERVFCLGDESALDLHAAPLLEPRINHRKVCGQTNAHRVPGWRGAFAQLTQRWA